MAFLKELLQRNELLFWLGAANLLLALVFGIWSRLEDIPFSGTHALYKPIKFALSVTLYCWSLAWFSGYLGEYPGKSWMSLLLLLIVVFEMTYISAMAVQGRASHFDVSNPTKAMLYGLMAIGATGMSLVAAYFAFLFFQPLQISLPISYLWGIRLGLLLFVVFAFQGFAMGSRLTHSIGGPDGGPGLPFLGWNLNYGDLRIAHAIGMHAMQVLPLLAWFLFRDRLPLLVGFAGLYFILAAGTWWMALQGKSPFSPRSSTKTITQQ